MLGKNGALIMSKFIDQKFMVFDEGMKSWLGPYGLVENSFAAKSFNSPTEAYDEIRQRKEINGHSVILVRFFSRQMVNSPLTNRN